MYLILEAVMKICNINFPHEERQLHLLFILTE